MLTDASPPDTLPPANPPPWASPPVRREARPPPPGLTLWLEEAPAPVRATTVPQALWFALFAQHRDVILANLRAALDHDLAAQGRQHATSPPPLGETALLDHLLAQQSLVMAAHPETGALLAVLAEDMPRNLGVGFLRTWAQPQLLPRFLREALDPPETPSAQSEVAAGEFFDYVLMELANGEHFFDIAVTAGVPVYAVMRFMRAHTDGDPVRQSRLQQALDDGVDVATAAFARMADDPRVSDETLERHKQALVARRDLILRLQDSRYAPPASVTRAGMRVSAGGMQIDFTFDASAPGTSTRFQRSVASTPMHQIQQTPTPGHAPTPLGVVDVAAREVPT